MKPSCDKVLRAFTLLETMVVIIISCFFVTMVYSSVHLFLLSYEQDKNRMLSEGDLWILEGSLLHESETAEILLASIPESLLLCIMPNRDTIRYKFRRSHIQRCQGNRTDTFDISCLEIQFMNNKKLIEYGITDEMVIATACGKHCQKHQFYKNYTPEIFFNHIDIRNRKE